MSELRANTISDAAGTGPVTLTGQSAAKAYIYAGNNGSTLKELNVSSGVDNGVGDYSFNFTNSFDSADYSHVATAETNVGRIAGDKATGKTASTMGTVVLNDSGTFADNRTSNAVHGDLA